MVNTIKRYVSRSGKSFHLLFFPRFFSTKRTLHFLLKIFTSRHFLSPFFFFCFRFFFRENTRNLLKKTNVARARAPTHNNHKIYFIDASIKMIEEGSSIKKFLLALIAIIMCINVETYVFARILIKLNKNWRMKKSLCVSKNDGFFRNSKQPKRRLKLLPSVLPTKNF